MGFYDDKANAVPPQWLCKHTDTNGTACSKFAVAANITPSAIGSDGFLANRLRCIDHAFVAGKSNCLTVGENGHPLESTVRFGPFNVAYMDGLQDAVKTVVAINKTRFDAVNSLQYFKDSVVETTVEWDGGCREGKVRFLEELGLSWPKTSVTLTLRFEYDGDPDDISSYDVEAGLKNYLSDAFEDFDMEVDY